MSITLAGQQFWLATDKDGRIIRGGIPAQHVAITRVDGIAVSKLGGAKPDYSAPVGAPYSAEEVTVPTTLGHTLGGTFSKPVNATGTLAVVVSITGSGPQDRDEYIGIVPKGYRPFRQIADTLGKLGIAMLRMDDRGFGASGGNFAAATTRDFANDIRAGIAYIRARPDVDPKRIFLAGHSEGGMIAPMVAVDEPTLAGIVVMAGPARNGREILQFQMRYGIEHDTAMTGAKREAALEGGGKPRCHHARVSRAESPLHPSAGRQSVGLRHTVVKSCSAGSGRHARRLGEGAFDSDAVSPMRAE